MKKIIILSYLSLMGVTLLLSSCSKSSSSNTEKNPTSSLSSNTSSNSSYSGDELVTSSELLIFSMEELAKYNGKNGSSAYVAVDGVVYDVTNSNKWKEGSHQGYNAGTDLTEYIGKSPHGKSILDEMPVVGKME